mmetsp:Transcript_12239/g.16004  ORF Transcript_12239/g.16004 Transcript_12239/m.16004 type:complete len:182 (-) Transcript_12239:186-731(-)|eukprot:CAMPEP_0198149944 /NCGR_PEP_ID=MMETSP1443-20131203/48720_1 /TAXON_ID=186043 /ORGANISM="Entomoneis sp., Strain CCMP2396" /LENGTH=181 /DNA_ID=CAMNT_0043815115 /DNA_START=73 /DNA_END=618 /DNA_ORIENTATION=-
MMRSTILLIALFGASAASVQALENPALLPEDHFVVEGINNNVQQQQGNSGLRGLTHADGGGGGWGNHEGCPTDEKYSATCLESCMPPYPYCTKLSAEEWVKKAIDGSSRCCAADGDLSECKCPVKDSECFLSKIKSHCEGIEMCKAQQQQVLALLEEQMRDGVDAVDSSVERLQVSENGFN